VGLTRYYQNFVQNNRKIVAPLIALLNINSFNWNATAHQSFHTFKEAMCTTPILAPLDFTQTFSWSVIPLGKALGKFSCKKEDHWPSLINNFLRYTWKNTPMKRKFWLFCTRWISNVLIWLGNASKLKLIIVASNVFWISSPEQQKWLTKMFGYDYEIIYKKRKENLVVDSLSGKYEEEGSLFSISFIIDDWLKLVHHGWFQYHENSSLIQQLEGDTNVSPWYTWKNEELHYKGHLYLRKHSHFKSTMLFEIHALKTLGNYGFHKTYEQIKHYFF